MTNQATTDGEGSSVGTGESRYSIIRCESPGAEHLAVIWDRLEEQVLDVIDAVQAAKYARDDL